MTTKVHTLGSELSLWVVPPLGVCKVPLGGFLSFLTEKNDCLHCTQTETQPLTWGFHSPPSKLLLLESIMFEPRETESLNQKFQGFKCIVFQFQGKNF